MNDQAAMAAMNAGSTVGFVVAPYPPALLTLVCRPQSCPICRADLNLGEVFDAQPFYPVEAKVEELEIEDVNAELDELSGSLAGPGLAEQVSVRSTAAGPFADLFVHATGCQGQRQSR